MTNTDDVNGVVASGDEEDDKEYEVEKILKQKRERGKTLFLVSTALNIYNGSDPTISNMLALLKFGSFPIPLAFPDTFLILISVYFFYFVFKGSLERIWSQ